DSGAAVGAALRGLDIGEAGAELGLRGPVDLTLPAGDILPVQAGGLSGGGSEGGGAGAEGGRAEHPSAQQGAARGARGPGGRCGRGEVAGMVGRHDVCWGGGGSGERGGAGAPRAAAPVLRAAAPSTPPRSRERREVPVVPAVDAGGVRWRGW